MEKQGKDSLKGRVLQGSLKLCSLKEQSFDEKSQFLQFFGSPECLDSLAKIVHIGLP